MEQISLLKSEVLTDTHCQARRPVKRSDWRQEVEPLQPQLPMLCEGFEDLFEWSEDDIAKARCVLLTDSINELSDNRTRAETCDEIWEWVASDRIHPFSFRVCVQALCADLGISVEITEVRERIRWLVRRLRAANSRGENKLFDITEILKLK